MVQLWRPLLIVFFSAVAALASDDLFSERVAPVFEARCIYCHSGGKPKGGLSLVAAADLLKGGENGPVVVTGRPDDSLLFTYVSGNEPQMPQEGEPLPSADVAAIRQWIENGAYWPDGVKLADKRQYDLDWWSLQPLTRAEVPAIASAWVRTPIDVFILAKLKEHELAPSPEADRRTLIRRLYFDFIGLPPPPDEVDAFIIDNHPQSYERLVDRLLASPQYGERWARHWLDVARYGDTHGYDKDKLRPNAWPYRDYVIRAFNEDKPYARFVEEQVAGDVLYPGTADGIIATGFLVAGPFDYVGQIEVAEGTLAKAITRNLDRDDMVSTVIGTFNSMTAYCARCHNHKFDPITQEDYYSLQAVFAGIDRAEQPYGGGEGPAQQTVFAAATEFKPEGQFTPTRGKPRPIHLLNRGNEKDPVAEVGPGTCSYFPHLESRFLLNTENGEGARRAALARWLTDKRNPLTWRSIVNRVWQYHFGRGIVDSPNDFGRMGELPSHPELLDWLAAEFRDGPQSIKSLHRLICTSAVYRQASAGNFEFERRDGNNQYLWRMNRRRLEAEAVRDSVLTVAGKLNLEPGGPPFRAFGFTDDHSPHYRYADYDPDDPLSHRRSIYRLIVRSVPDPFMTTLDCSDPSASVPKRNETVTPLQSLALLNNTFMVRMAEHFAARIEPLGNDNIERLTAAWRLAFGRKPHEEELSALVSYADRHGLANACRLILNMNEFVFID
ncbi:MAG TPA: PSD1 and planctomycete cytochrome C domain-containing protein [Lacipirellulaceae bacterium]